MTEATSIGFDHINLNEVDPTGMKIPEGEVLSFVVTKAVETTWGPNAKGNSGTCIDLVFSVINSENFTGKNFYTRMFPDKDPKQGGKSPTARRLRILRDATGVSQTADVIELLEALVSQRAEFSAPVVTPPAREGYEAKQEVNLWQAKPIS